MALHAPRLNPTPIDPVVLTVWTLSLTYVGAFWTAVLLLLR